MKLDVHVASRIDKELLFHGDEGAVFIFQAEFGLYLYLFYSYI